MEAIKLGARLATGTQVILEQAEGVLGDQSKYSVTAETLPIPFLGDEVVQQGVSPNDEEEASEVISKYAQQPMDIKEGVQSAYKSLQRNFNSAAQTILAVPMEVYERSGNEASLYHCYYLLFLTAQSGSRAFRHPRSTCCSIETDDWGERSC
jgi:autophagy-related protein 2